MKLRSSNPCSWIKQLALLGLLGLSLNTIAAETGNVCPTQSSTRREVRIHNGQFFPIIIRVPRNEWVCHDFSGTGTPGQFDNVILEPGQLKYAALEIAATYPFHQAVVSKMTFAIYYYTTRVEYRPLTRFRMGTDYNHQLILYNPDASYVMETYKTTEYAYRSPYRVDPLPDYLANPLPTQDGVVAFELSDWNPDRIRIYIQPKR